MTVPLSIFALEKGIIGPFWGVSLALFDPISDTCRGPTQADRPIATKGMTSMGVTQQSAVTSAPMIPVRRSALSFMMRFGSRKANSKPI